MQPKRYQSKIICIVGLFCLIVAGLIFVAKYPGKRSEFINTISLKYSFSIQNTTSVAIKNAAMLASTPLPVAAMQNSGKAEANHPFKPVRDIVGNTYLDLRWDLIPPYSTKVVIIDSEVQIRKPLQKSKSNSSGNYLDAEPCIESDHKLIKEMALMLTAKKKKETIHNIFRWVSENMQYTGYVKKNRGALYALKYRKGDCTEFATLFVALCRAGGIPARYMGGFVATKSSVFNLGDYHNWAEFHHDGRWHLADPQHKIFMNDSEATTYIAFKIIQPSRGDSGALLTGIKGTGLKIK